MIQRGIEGFWLSISGVFLAGMLMVICGAAQAQAELNVKAPELAAVQKMLDDRSDAEGRNFLAVVLPAQADFFALADRREDDGYEIYRLQVSAQGALAISVYFDDFHLPAGSELWFTSPEGKYAQTWAEGPVTSFENDVHRRWVNREAPGDEVVMTYRAPVGLTEDRALDISGVGFFARKVRLDEPWQSILSRGGSLSEPCQVNVQCPEGDSWECEKAAVVRLQITQNNFVSSCSGAMVNNTSLDCRQLLLTSFHCFYDLEETDWPYLKVRFNYQTQDCNTSAGSFAPQRTGVIRLGDSNDIPPNGFIYGSDYLLLEVEDEIPTSWNPFFAGWDATGYSGSAGVGIHHPAGDFKKISTYTSPLLNSNYYAFGAHWRVVWQPTVTNHGVTEGGSSGSPIFEENHRIIGTLTSGLSFCNSPSSPDYYGKMSYHWDGPNPSGAVELKSLLDPTGTGLKILDGSYRVEQPDGTFTCDGFNACEATSVEEAFLSGLVVSPNPTAGEVRVEVPSGFAVAEVQIFDAMGRALATETKFAAQGSWTLDLSSFGEGMRYITVMFGAFKTKVKRNQLTWLR